MVSPDLIVIKRWTGKQITALIFAIALILVLFSASAYWLGNRDGANLRDENSQLQKVVDTLTLKLEDSRRVLVKQKQISKVDQAANAHAGNSMDLQHQQIRELERELKFFRSIMAPEESIKGLQISRFNWQKQELNSVSWQLSLIQAGSQGRTISGNVRIELIAMKGNEQIRIAIHNELQKNKSQNTEFNYRFRYFQHLTGNLSISDDIIPISINVIAQSTVKGQMPIEKQFPWQSDEEKLANVE